MASDKRIVERIFRSYMLVSYSLLYPVAQYGMADPQMMAFYGIRVEEGTGRLDVTDDYKVQREYSQSSGDKHGPSLDTILFKYRFSYMTSKSKVILMRSP